MSRLLLLPVVVLVSVVAPSVAHAQYAVVSPCAVDAYGCARISIVPAPPTALPAWLQPKPMAPPPVAVPRAPVYLPPVYIAPPATRSSGIDPYIPLAVQPPRIAPPGDVLNQLLLLEALAARRARPAPAPVYVAPAPAPAPPRAPGENWMSAFVKGVD